MQTGAPSQPSDLIDRETEVNTIVSKMKSSINYNIAIIGYRRIGKSSILLKAKQILSKNQKIVVVYFDVKKNLGEPKIFLSRLQKAIFYAYLEKLGFLGKVKARTAQAKTIPSKILETLTSKKIKSTGFEIGPEGTITPKLEFGEKEKEYGTLFYSVFELATTLAENSKLKFVIILDEFQDIEELDRYPGLKNIFSLFRSVIQERGKRVSFIISGSRVHLLKTILESGEKPLFLHFNEQVIEEMDKENSIKLFNKYLKQRKISLDSKIAEEAYHLVGGHPLYLMTLGEYWDKNKSIDQVFDHLLTSPIGPLRLYVEYVLAEDLGIVKGGPILRTILQTLAQTETGYSYSELSKKLLVPMTKLPFYIDGLIRADLIAKGKDGFVIRDRVVRKYLQMEASMPL
jgi:AAA+ ATPase superfamily predicted ATPase